MDDLTRKTITDVVSILHRAGGILKTIIVTTPSVPSGPAQWHTPVGTSEFPAAAWYVATVHDLTGRKNKGYRHSGIDLNLDRSPWGDVDRGEPVFAVAAGKVYGTWHSVRNLASVVIEIEHAETPLYCRYWHLARDETFLSLRPGRDVEAGQVLGHLGAYSRGDHLHFDMALDEFHPGCWLIPAVRWVDPVPILKEHLSPVVVGAMMKRADG